MSDRSRVEISNMYCQERKMWIKYWWCQAHYKWGGHYLERISAQLEKHKDMCQNTIKIPRWERYHPPAGEINNVCKWNKLYVRHKK